MTNYNQDKFNQLKTDIETLVGRTIKTPKDFEFLSRQIQGYTQESVSVSTLKRMWGYVTSTSNPSQYNLNLLSRMVGFADWNAYCQEGGGIASSHFFLKSKLISEALEIGEEVKLTWCPGRIVTIKYLGHDKFKVLESINSKLDVGDVFSCHQFVADEPLYLSNLTHIYMQLCNYVCGKISGIKWYVPEKS